MGPTPSPTDSTVRQDQGMTADTTAAPAPTTDSTAPEMPAPTSTDGAVAPSDSTSAASSRQHCGPKSVVVGVVRSVVRNEPKRSRAKARGRFVLSGGVLIFAVLPFLPELTAMPPIRVTRTYLEITSPGDLRPAAITRPAPRIEQVEDCSASFFRYLYTEVGRDFHWTDRLPWSDETIGAIWPPQECRSGCSPGEAGRRDTSSCRT